MGSSLVWAALNYRNMALTIAEMHIGIDLALQQLNSNLYGTVMAEEKDFIINSVTDDLVRLVLLNEDNKTKGYVSVQDIKKLYSVLSNFIIEEELTLVALAGIGYTFDLAETNEIFHYYMSSISYMKTGYNIKSGQLVKDEWYVMTVPGTTDLTGVGSAPPNSTNKVFQCTLGATKDTKYLYRLANSSVDWDGTTTLRHLTPIVNRIAQPEDIDNFNSNSFASSSITPIITFDYRSSSGFAVIHTNNNYSIYKLMFKYIKFPPKVNSVSDPIVNSKLPSFVHQLLVDLAARKIAGYTNNPIGNNIQSGQEMIQ